MTAVRQGTGTRNVALSLSGGPRDAAERVLRESALVSSFDDQHRYFEIQMKAGADPQTLLRALVNAGALIERFELVQPSLHQIFIERVGASGIETGMSGHG